MAKNSRWKVVPSVLTLALIACEGSITAIADPVPDVEARQRAAPQGGAVVEAEDLIAWWPGEGDFKDIAGTHDITTNQGVTTTDGVADSQAYLFTGDDFGPEDSGQFLEINDAATLRPIEFTIDLWAHGLGDGQDAIESILIEKAIENGEYGFRRKGGPGLSYLIAWRGTGANRHIEAHVAFSNTPITDLPARLVSGPVADGEWVHVALTVAADRTATLYVNGKAVDNFQATAGAPVYGNGSIVIGNTWLWARDHDEISGTTFNGCIDEVRIFGRALNLDEIKEIYGEGDDGPCSAEEPESEPANTAPTVNLETVDGEEINEGDTFTSSAGFFTDPDEDSWTATVDYGDDPDADPQALTLGENKSFDLSHPYADDGTYEITVTVTDDAGGVGASSAKVIVNNVVPSVDEGPDEKVILEGETYTSSVSFTDPGADEWTATVDYGDGSPVENPTLDGKSFELSHVYADNNSDNTPYDITVTVTDDEGGMGASSAKVVVNNVAPSIYEGPDDDVIVEGETYTSYVKFGDPGVDEWTALVDYGDGTLETLEMIEKTFQLSHTYAANEACGPFTVTVTLTDDDLGETSSAAQVTVIHQISVSKANVKLKRGRSTSGPRDRFDVAGRLPLSLLECFDPYNEGFTVNFSSFEGFGGFQEMIPAGSFVRKGHKWALRDSRRRHGIRKFDIHDDGRFKIQATDLDLTGAYFDFMEPVHFSLSFGPDDMGTASIQFDRRLHFRAHDDDDDDFDDDNDD